MRGGRPVAGVPFQFVSTSTDPGGRLTSLRWSFGDGSSGSGLAPVHTYSRTGRFTVRLSVVDASGQTASTSQTVQVVAASIGAVSLKAGLRVETLLVRVTGPGTLRVGSSKLKVRGPRTIKVRVVLTAAQRSTLRSRHRLTIHVTLTFTPKTGHRTTKRYAIQLTLR